MTAIDPDRAARLIADAERAALPVTDRGFKGSVLGRLARTMAVPDWRDRAAQAVDDECFQASVLAHIARAAAAIDPDRAARLAKRSARLSKRAERDAQAIADAEDRASALASIAIDVAAADPDRAGHIAQSIPDEAHIVPVLVQTAAATANP